MGTVLVNHVPSSEMAAKGGSGLHLRLRQVPTHEPGISPYEMILRNSRTYVTSC